MSESGQGNLDSTDSHGHPGSEHVRVDIADIASGQQQQSPPTHPPSSKHSGIPALLWNAFSLRIMQIGVLMWKDLIVSIRHPFNTLFHLFLPALIVFGVFLLNLAIRTSTMAAMAGHTGEILDSDPLFPKAQPVPQLPESSPDAFVLFLSPCMDDLYPLYEAIARSQDPPLSIPSKGSCINSVMSENECTTDICIFGERDQMQKSMWAAGKTLGKKVHSAVLFNYQKLGTGVSLGYELYYNATSLKRNPFILSDPFMALEYDHSISVQRTVHEAILQTYTGVNMQIDLQHRPFPQLDRSGLPSDNVSLVIPFAFYAALFLASLFTHYSLNNERELKLREVMAMAGMRDSSYFLSVFFTQSIFNVLAVGIMVSVGYATQLAFFINSNPVPILLLFIIMGESLIAMFIMMSTYVSSSVWTNVNAMIVLAIGLVPLVAWIDAFGIPLGLLALKESAFFALNIVLPSWSFGKVVYDIWFLAKELQNPATGEFYNSSGYRFEDMFNVDIYKEAYHLLLGDARVPSSAENMAYILLSVVFFMILTWYLDAVLPGSTKRRQPIYFFLLPSYWGFTGKGREGLAIDVAKHNTKNFASILPDTDRDIYNEYQSVISSLDTDPDHNQFPLKVVKLSKVYGGGVLNFRHHTFKTALENVTVSASLGEVLVVLGHNAAGKSTLFNCLTGKITASSGDALVFGHSVINSLSKVSSMMGVVQQEDFFFPELTAAQHIRLFATLRGISQLKIQSLIREKLGKVLLYKQRNHRVATFSGGMKRRLSVAVATVGDPKVILMDEVSSGLDPAVRRRLWDYISELKKDRLVVMTTHSMDEAEAVGDKICVLALGRVRAIGDPLHLKKRFGSGYTVELIAAENGQRIEQLKTRIAQISPSCSLLTEATSSLTYKLPDASRELSELFEFLEQESERGRQKHGSSDFPVLVSDFLVSYTTLEEAFLAITHGRDGTLEDEYIKQSHDKEIHQLNVILETQDPESGDSVEQTLGFIDIRNDMTLSDVRIQIQANITRGVPEKFVFLSDGVPTSAIQEKFRFATSYLPVITVREPSTDAVWDPNSRNVTVQSSLSPPPPSAGSMEQTVAALQQEVDHLKKLVARLQEENARLRNEREIEK